MICTHVLRKVSSALYASPVGGHFQVADGQSHRRQSCFPLPPTATVPPPPPRSSPPLSPSLSSSPEPDPSSSATTNVVEPLAAAKMSGVSFRMLAFQAGHSTTEKVHSLCERDDDTPQRTHHTTVAGMASCGWTYYLPYIP